MSTTTFATKRLWIRRTRKLGLIIVSPFNWVYDWVSDLYYCYGFGQLVFISLILTVTIGFSLLFPYTVYLTFDASPESILVARKHNACANDIIISVANGKISPLTYGDLRQSIATCEKRVTLAIDKAKQAKALE